MGERRCRYCEKNFQPSKYQPKQAVCRDPACQQRRRSEYRAQKLATDAEYRQVCRDSACKWRSQNPGYWKRYREENPQSVSRNCEQQQKRDRRHRLLDLANNNSVPAQVWVIEPLPPRKGPGWESCKQQPAGFAASFAG
jgi:hypothetical protein